MWESEIPFKMMSRMLLYGTEWPSVTEDPQSVSPQWGSAAGMRRCCQQAGTGIKGDSSGCRGRIEIGNPHWSVQRCKCHTSTTGGCHYVTRVTFHEEDSTHKGRPLGCAWHLLLGAASGGETSPVGISRMWNLYIHVCIGGYLINVSSVGWTNATQPRDIVSLLCGPD